MSIDNYLYLNATPSRHELRYMLVWADIGLEADSDYGKNATAFSEHTSVSIHDDLSSSTYRPDNGVMATRIVNFDCRRKNDPVPYWAQTTRGVVARLRRLLPEADAFWEALDGRHPMLIHREGCLVLSEETRDLGKWDLERRPRYRDLIDLSYAIEPLNWDQNTATPRGGLRTATDDPVGRHGLEP